MWAVRNFAGRPVASLVPEQLDDGGLLTWPNNVQAAPMGGFVVGDGFLPPGRSNGGVYWFPAGYKVPRGPHGSLRRQSDRYQQSPPLALAPPRPGWFYHQTRFIDLNGDGRQDIITARAHKPLFGAGQGELVRAPGRCNARHSHAHTRRCGWNSQLTRLASHGERATLLCGC